MDEVDRLAWRIMDAFEGIPELRLIWLTVPDDLDAKNATVEIEAVSTEEFFTDTEVLGEARVPLEVLRGMKEEDLCSFFRREIIEREEFREAIIEALIIADAADQDVPSPEEAERN